MQTVIEWLQRAAVQWWILIRIMKCADGEIKDLINTIQTGTIEYKYSFWYRLKQANT